MIIYVPFRGFVRKYVNVPYGYMALQFDTNTPEAAIFAAPRLSMNDGMLAIKYLITIGFHFWIQKEPRSERYVTEGLHHNRYRWHTSEVLYECKRIMKGN